VYYECLDGCQKALMEKRGLSHVIEDSDYCVFHLGSGPKFVKHAFERCMANAFGFKAAKNGRTKKYDGKLSVEETAALFDRKVAASLRLATRIGPQHTVAVYTNLTSLMIHKGAKGAMVGKTINVFSYGSGAASTMFRLRVSRMPGIVHDMHEKLDQRNYVDAAVFDSIMDEYAETYGRTGWTARVRNGPQPAGAYYLKGVDAHGRRSYFLLKDPSGVWRLPPPYVSEPPPPPTREDLERFRAALPERSRNVPELSLASGVDAPHPPLPPREVTDEEMYELGLMERPPPPPEVSVRSPADGRAMVEGGVQQHGTSRDLSAMLAGGAIDPAALAELLQALASEGSHSPSAERTGDRSAGGTASRGERPHPRMHPRH
jgi:hypothetical protein